MLIYGIKLILPRLLHKLNAFGDKETDRQPDSPANRQRQTEIEMERQIKKVLLICEVILKKMNKMFLHT